VPPLRTTFDPYYKVVRRLMQNRERGPSGLTSNNVHYSIIKDRKSCDDTDAKPGSY
jgi:hypothetical protein